MISKVSSRKCGVIRSFDSERGFGFIRSGDSQDEVFVHARSLPAEWTDNTVRDQLVGQVAEFDLTADDSGRLRAENVFLHAKESSPIRREAGTVKWFRGNYGFITRLTGEDVFVFNRDIRDAIHRELQAGDPVEFFVVKSDRGLRALDVTAMTDEPEIEDGEMKGKPCQNR